MPIEDVGGLLPEFAVPAVSLLRQFLDRSFKRGGQYFDLPINPTGRNGSLRDAVVFRIQNDGLGNRNAG